MSIIRHGGPTNTQYREAAVTRDRQDRRQQEAERLTFITQDARRCAARAAVRGGWSSAELREVLEALDLVISPSALKRLSTLERNVNAGGVPTGRYKPSAASARRRMS